MSTRVQYIAVLILRGKLAENDKRIQNIVSAIGETHDAYCKSLCS